MGGAAGRGGGSRTRTSRPALLRHQEWCAVAAWPVVLVVVVAWRCLSLRRAGGEGGWCAAARGRAAQPVQPPPATTSHHQPPPATTSHHHGRWRWAVAGRAAVVRARILAGAVRGGPGRRALVRLRVSCC